jgi:hypothetical protein
MTGRERVLAAYEGRMPDCVPASAPYIMLSNADHWVEATGLPVWKFYEWQYLPPDAHAARYADFTSAMPFDVFEPFFGHSAQEREAITVVENDGRHFFRDRRDGSLNPVPDTIHEAGSALHANETRHVFTREDARTRITTATAERQIADGQMDFAKAAFSLYGGSHFFVTGGIVNTFYMCSFQFGLTNMFAALKEEPDLFHYVSSLNLEQNIERIRAYAAVGGDAVYIDDATATCDMISVNDFETFSLPYMREEVREIKRLGMKAICIYFGGIGDRADRILSLEPDALSMETSMKGYVNDLAAVAKLAAGKICLYGNLNPFNDVQMLSDAALENKVRLQCAQGSVGGRFVTSTGSPLTPGTPVSRIRRLIEMSHSMKP